MAILGRILQFAGWLWIAASFFGSFIDLPDVGFLPGLILVFVSRVLRTQIRRRQPSDEVAEVEAATPSTQTPRPLYTERSKESADKAKPEPATRATTSKQAPPKSQVVWPKDTPPDSSPQRDELLDKILVAGSELAEDKTGDLPTLEPSYEGKPLTSDEMIARARRRWDRKP
jgi:hypothetical protein